MPIPLSPGVTQINAQYRGARADAGGIRINFSSQSAALSELNQVIGQGVRYRPVDYSGVKEAAQGAANLVGSAVALRQRNQKITDQRKMYGAETHIIQGTMDLEGLLAGENDPTKWEELASKHMDTVLSGIDFEGMTPQAREHMTLYADRQRAMAIGKARNSSVVENERRMVGDGMSLIRIAEEIKDPALAGNAVRTLLDSGAVTPTQAQEMLISSAGKIQTARRGDVRDQVSADLAAGDFGSAQMRVDASQDLYPWERQAYTTEINKKRETQQIDDAIAQDPSGVFQKALDPNEFVKFSPAERLDISDRAFARMQEQSAQSYKQAADALARGTLTKPEQLDEPQWNGMLPARKAVLKETLAKGQPNNDTEWMSMAATISGFIPSGDEAKDNLAYADMEALVKTRFRGPYQDELLGMLASSRESSPEEPYTAAKAKLTQAFKDGYLGSYTVPYDEGYTPGVWGQTMGNPARPGTVLSPEDQARTADDVAKGQRLVPGALVVDQAKMSKARANLSSIMRQLDMMKKRGAKPEEAEAFVAEQIRVSGMVPLLPDSGDVPYRTPSTPTGAAPNPLLPAPSGTGSGYQDTIKFIQGLK